MEILINGDRLVREFVELTAIDSVSFKERAMADKLSAKLRDIGFEVYEDHAGEALGGSAGNIYGYLPGDVPGAPLLFSAHLDTVEPGVGKKAIVHPDGRITSDGTTVLGADNIAGVTEILEGIRSIREAGIAHRAIEVLFPIAEEVYVKGSGQFDFQNIKAKDAYVLDLSGDVGGAAIRAPSLISFRISIIGKAAHAGFEPEKGVHAISVMSRAIGKVKQGRVDEETTLNIGTLIGGTAANIVPDRCTCIGEVRSYDHAKAIAEIEKLSAIFAKATQEADALFEMETSVDLDAYSLSKASSVTERFEKACHALGLSGRLTSTFGGSDNHNLVKHGINGIVLSCGMYNVHSVSEYTKAEELKKGAALVAQLIAQDDIEPTQERSCE